MGKKRLTRKELVEHIRQTMPTEYDEYERLAFIEKKVADNICFDEQYLWGDREAKEKIYKLAKAQAQKSHKDVKRKLICVTMAELFGYVVREMGYDVIYQTRIPGQEDKTGENDIFKKVSPKKQEHVYPIVKLSDGTFIKVDIQSDLYRLQTRSKPKAFGFDEIQTKDGIKTSMLDNDTIERVFRKIYHLDEKGRFTDEYIMVFSTMLRCQRRSPMQIMEFFINDSKIQEELQNARCIEANKLYKKILSVSYDFSEGNQFFEDINKAIIEECILSDDKGNKRYSFCIYAEHGDDKRFYVYSKKTKRLVNLSQEEIQQITGQVMNVNFRGRPSELKNNMIAFVKGECKEPIQTKTIILLEDIFLDEEEEEL